MALTIFPVNHFFFTTEIANGGRPLFPGGDVDDQLRRIFKYPLMRRSIIMNSVIKDKIFRLISHCAH